MQKSLDAYSLGNVCSINVVGSDWCSLVVVVRLGSLLLWSLLHGLGEEGERLMGLLLEIVRVSNKRLLVDHLLVVKEHTSDLVGSILVLLLDDWVDSVSNGILPCVSIVALSEDLHWHKRGHGHLLLLLLLHHHLLLLLHHHLLLWGKLHWDARLLDARLLLGLVLSLDTIALHPWAAGACGVAWATTTAVVRLVELTTTAVVHLVALVPWHLLSWLTLDVLAVLAAHLSWLEISNSTSLISVEASEEVLLDLLLASGLSFLMKLAAWHPELD